MSSSILNLDEFISNSKPSIQLCGETFEIDNSFQALLSYQLALKELESTKDDEKFSKNLGAIIFGGTQNYEKVETLIQKNVAAKNIAELYKKIVSFWMESMNLPINENLQESKKKTSI